MLTPEKLVAILCEGRQFCAHDMYTDEAGLAYFLKLSPRTLRAWRAAGKGPRASRTTRLVFDLEGICSWWNAGGLASSTEYSLQETAGAGAQRQAAEESGRSGHRPVAAHGVRSQLHSSQTKKGA